MNEKKQFMPCPFCGHSFERRFVTTKYYMGEILEQYKCPNCDMTTPKMRCGGFLQDWWNTRANHQTA